jgi:hypothetical protein
MHQPSRLMRIMARFVGGPGPAGAVVRAAKRHASSALPDDAAKGRLQEELRDGGGVDEALRILSMRRHAFLDDRAYRLLAAVAQNAPVLPIDKAAADLFESEEKLGRASLVAAYALLAEHVPRLNDVKHMAADEQKRELGCLLGPASSHGNLLVRTELALSVATQYLAIFGGRLPRESEAESYFSSHHRVVVLVSPRGGLS